MSAINKDVPELDFSGKYTDEHARAYFHKHTDGFWRKLSNRREIRIARKALKMAGHPLTILDLPSGTGRFWSMLAEDETRKLYAADYSQSMLNVSMEERPRAITRHIETFQASAFDIPKPDNFVECIFSMRLLHHIGEREDRMKMLREFHRVTSDTVVISLWVDGNYKARKRNRLERRRRHKSYQNRFVQPREGIEAEMREAGFEIIGHVDFLKYYAMWRIYILRKHQVN
jgi:SAM-dependent methyltransferase